MIWQELVLVVRHRLSRVKTEDVMRDLRILAAHVLQVDASRMTLHMHDEVTEKQREHFNLLIDERMSNMPISKIIQKRLFWGREFDVDLNVLDPRGDTETLIAACLKLGPQDKILDLGTGSGAIGLTLAAEWPRGDVMCTDISDKALDVARLNMKNFGVADGVRLLRSDWFGAVEGRFDLIISNPPYIALEEWDALDFEVRGFDPRVALTDEADGLSCYRVIVAQAGDYLEMGGHLMVEIGHNQRRAVQDLFDAAGFTQITCLPDMAGRDRVVSGVWAV
ncbi:peptide chain release factor N(5)-glutamine methyltransferase [Planktotalea sp.]|uniref:peptide chain release factor N(5)-glutamine methyltransferase n=1 Tax=Planktotalea sp. TaxID=2029877 RepID=UPI0025F65F25|nr:peptide chain release factor N(5)-glutamine methyltransferase [Planktotalea sp.]